MRNALKRIYEFVFILVVAGVLLLITLEMKDIKYSDLNTANVLKDCY